MNNIFRKLDAITGMFSYGYIDTSNKIHNTVDSEFVEKFEDEMKVPVIAIGTGEKDSDIIYK